MRFKAGAWIYEDMKWNKEKPRITYDMQEIADRHEALNCVRVYERTVDDLRNAEAHQVVEQAVFGRVQKEAKNTNTKFISRYPAGLVDLKGKQQ